MKTFCRRVAKEWPMASWEHRNRGQSTANLPTNIVDFGVFDSSIRLLLRGGILMPIEDFPESLSQAM